MALQNGSNNAPSQSADYSIGGNTPVFVAGGSTTTTERPTGGSVTQNGNAVLSTAAGGVFTSTGSNSGTIGGSRTEQGGNRRTENTGTIAGTVSDSMAAGSQISSYFSGGGKGLGAVLGNADAPNTVAVNPQGTLNAGNIAPLLLLAIPLAILAIRKK